MNTGKQKNIFSLWVLWQFYEAPKFLLLVWNNYMNFASDFFSFKQLLKTFFSPWHRYKWSYPKVFDIKEFFNTLISNTVSRILGAMMRVALIIAGAVFQVFVALAGAAIFVAWLLVPFAVAAGILFALIL